MIRGEVEMTASDTTRNETAECISEAHLLYIREYIRYEEAKSKATLDRFLAAKLNKPSDSPEA
jgi:hypothetical protein